MDILKTYRIDKQLADDIKRLAEYYGSARRVLEIAVGMLDKSSGHIVDEPEPKVMTMRIEPTVYKVPMELPPDLEGDLIDEVVAMLRPKVLDAVAEPGKAKVSFERERKPQVHVKNPADTPDEENERWRKAAKEARETGGLPSVVRRPIRPKGSKL